MIRCLLALTCVAVAAPALAQEERTPLAGPFTFYIENDSLPLAGGDESYSQGLELQAALGKHPWPGLVGVMRTLKGARPFDEQSSLLIGQTIFTPQNIITYDPPPVDRPFVGHLYGGLSVALVAGQWSTDEDGHRRRPRRYTGRLTVGATGSVALARNTQGAFHVLRESRIPKGWYTQESSRPEVNAVLIREDVFAPLGFKLRRWVDVTTAARMAVGTTQIFAAGGGVLRVGKALSSFPPTGIVVTAAPEAAPEFEIAAFGGGELRSFALNRLADQGDGPSFRPLVWEWRAGAYARWKSGLSVSYAVVRRGQEIEPLAPGIRAEHWVGSVQVSKSPARGPAGSGGGPRWLGGTRVNFGLGLGGSDVEPDLPLDPSTSLAAHWGLEYVIKGRLAAGIETTGLAREHGRNTAGEGHKDTFLLPSVATLGVDLLPRLESRHRIQLRAGAGLARVKTQTIPTEGDIEEPELEEPLSDGGWSALVGVRYTFRTGQPLSLAMEGTYSRLSLDGVETGVERATCWTWTLGVQIHPWGRDRRPRS